jgi:hypothetical protein
MSSTPAFFHRPLDFGFRRWLNNWPNPAILNPFDDAESTIDGSVVAAEPFGPGSRWRFHRAEFFGSGIGGLASPETRCFYAKK